MQLENKRKMQEFYLKQANRQNNGKICRKINKN
jgi:hypothetical protein